MKLLRKHSNKKSESVTFVLFVDILAPWPTLHGNLIVEWQRGKRSGRTKPAEPDHDIPHTSATYVFGETLTVPATIYRSSGGGYEPKTLHIYISQPGAGKEPNNTVGSLELNLADLVLLEGTVRQQFPIECSSSILTSTGSRPQLTLTIAVARGNQRVDDLAAQIAGLQVDDRVPSTLSSTTDTSRPSSIAGDNRSRTPQSMSRSTANRVDNGTDTARNSYVGPHIEGASTITSAPPASVEYDSDGFIIDSDVNSNNQVTETPGTIRRNLKADMDDMARPQRDDDAYSDNNASAYGAAATPVTASGGLGGGGRDIHHQPTVVESSDATGSSAVSPISPAMLGSPTGRRFTNANTALGSKRWAWRRQSQQEQFPFAGAHEDSSENSHLNGHDKSVAASTTTTATTTTAPGTTIKKNNSSTPVLLMQLGVPSFKSATASREHSLGMSGNSIPDVSMHHGSTVDSATIELQSMAALESSVYQAGHGWWSCSSSYNSILFPAADTSTASSAASASLSAFLLRSIGGGGNGRSSSSPDRAAGQKAGRDGAAASRTVSENPKPYPSTDINPKMLRAPARRLARTIIILGQEQGTAFAARAVSAIESVAQAAFGDVHKVLLWWGTVVTLRWSLWALTLGGNIPSSEQGETTTEAEKAQPSDADTAPSSQFSWLQQSLIPALLRLEESLFVSALDALWNCILLPSAKNSAAGDSNRKTTDSMANGGAVSHWTHALHAADVALNDPARPKLLTRGLFHLARRRLLLCLLDRLDSLFFTSLISTTASTSGTFFPDSLDQKLLPCQSSAQLTFDVGVELKISAGRLVNWAADVGIKEGPALRIDLPHKTELKLFPRVRAAADLLMMSKNMLTDADIRQEVAPNLSSSAVYKLLSKYRSLDDSGTGGDSTTPALLKQLKKESVSESGDSLVVDSAMEGYSIPDEVILLEEGVVQPLSLEMNADSDDELTSLQERSGNAYRFDVLRELWSAVRVR